MGHKTPREQTEAEGPLNLPADTPPRLSALDAARLDALVAHEEILRLRKSELILQAALKLGLPLDAYLLVVRPAEGGGWEFAPKN